MSIYLDKLSHIQVVINCRNTDARMYTREDALANVSGEPSIDDVMNYSLLTTLTLKTFSFVQVVDFVAGLAGCASVKELFRSQAIDGRAFLLLKSEHLTGLGIKMGPGNL